MRWLIRILLILLMGSFVGWPKPNFIGPAAASGDAISPASVEDFGHLRVLRLHGTPYEMGYQHGAAERAAIRERVEEEVFERRILGVGESHAALLALAHDAADELPRDVRQELRGIAEGAGLAYDDVLLLNLLLGRLSARATLPSVDLEARAFAAWPPAVRENDGPEEILLGYQMDAPGLASELRRHLLVLVYHPVEGQAHAVVAQSGQVSAWCGLNRDGLALCATPPGLVRDVADELPPALLIRGLLARAQDGEQALRQAIDQEYAGDFQLLIADRRRNRAVAVAFAAHQYRIVEPETGLLTLEPGRERLASLLKRNVGWLSSEKALAALASRRSSTGEAPGLCGESTLLNILLVPGQGELWIGLDLWPAACRRYLRVGLFE